MFGEIDKHRGKAEGKAARHECLKCTVCSLSSLCSLYCACSLCNLYCLMLPVLSATVLWSLYATSDGFLSQLVEAEHHHLAEAFINTALS